MEVGYFLGSVTCQISHDQKVYDAVLYYNIHPELRGTSVLTVHTMNRKEVISRELPHQSKAMGQLKNKIRIIFETLRAILH